MLSNKLLFPRTAKNYNLYWHNWWNSLIL